MSISPPHLTSHHITLPVSIVLSRHLLHTIQPTTVTRITLLISKLSRIITITSLRPTAEAQPSANYQTFLRSFYGHIRRQAPHYRCSRRSLPLCADNCQSIKTILNFYGDTTNEPLSNTAHPHLSIGNSQDDYVPQCTYQTLLFRMSKAFVTGHTQNTSRKNITKHPCYGNKNSSRILIQLVLFSYDMAMVRAKNSVQGYEFDVQCRIVFRITSNYQSTLLIY